MALSGSPLLDLYAAARRAPSGMTPVSTKRHRAMSSLRANPTAMIFFHPALGACGAGEEPLGERALRLKDQRHINWVRILRTRGLPFLLKPCSRLDPPLS
jgi:hypothetical protein